MGDLRGINPPPVDAAQVDYSHGGPAPKQVDPAQVDYSHGSRRPKQVDRLTLLKWITVMAVVHRRQLLDRSAHNSHSLLNCSRSRSVELWR
jgi:hypothetical protein